MFTARRTNRNSIINNNHKSDEKPEDTRTRCVVLYNNHLIRLKYFNFQNYETYITKCH